MYGSLRQQKENAVDGIHASCTESVLLSEIKEGFE